MKIIAQTLFVLLLSLLGFSAHAETYIVKPGDMLGRIAIARATTVRFLMEENKAIKNPDRIYIDQILNVPKIEEMKKVKEEVKKPQFKRNRYTFTARAEAATQDRSIDNNFDGFLLKTYPKSVATMLKQEVYDEIFVDTILTGTAPNAPNPTPYESVAATGIGREHARLYRVMENGVTYSLFYLNKRDTWYGSAATPDLGALAAIKSELEELIGTERDVMPLAALIWANRYGGVPPPAQYEALVAQSFSSSHQ